MLAALVGVALCMAFHYGAMYMQASDTELLSGTVVKKERRYDPETEAYVCGTDSKGHAIMCTRTIPRWRWSVISNIDDSYSEHTYSKTNVPEIYDFTAIGDPYTRTKRFVNFQYVSDQTILLNKHVAYEGWLPEYPKLYGGFKVDRGLSRVVESDVLSHELAKAQRIWGPRFGVNVIVAVVDVPSSDFYHALQSKWVGGKKNDAVLVLRVDKQNRIIESVTFSRSTSERVDPTGLDFNRLLQVSAMDTKQYDVTTLIPAIEKALPLFQRENLRQYDFLESEYSPPWYINVLGWALTMAAMLLTVKIYDDRFGRRRYHRRGFF